MMIEIQMSLAPNLELIGDTVAWVCQRLPPWADTVGFGFAVTEALTNAIVHGVLQLDSSTRECDYNDYLARARARAAIVGLPPISLRIRRDDDTCSVAIRWQGSPCPASLREPPDEPVDIFAAAGRGLAIIYDTCSRVQWCDDGLEIELVPQRAQELSSRAAGG